MNWKNVKVVVTGAGGFIGSHLTEELARKGAKVRALTQGRFNASFDDIQAVLAPALRHRLILNFEAEAEGITTDHVIAQLLKEVPKMAEVVSA